MSESPEIPHHNFESEAEKNKKRSRATLAVTALQNRFYEIERDKRQSPVGINLSQLTGPVGHQDTLANFLKKDADRLREYIDYLPDTYQDLSFGKDPKAKETYKHLAEGLLIKADIYLGEHNAPDFQ